MPPSGFPDNARGIRNIYNATHGASAAETPSERSHPYKYTYCHTDEDCALVPECYSRQDHTYQTSSLHLRAVNKHYFTECQGPVLCNGKCRCDSEEESYTWKSEKVSSCAIPLREGSRLSRRERGCIDSSIWREEPIILRTRCVNSICTKDFYSPEQEQVEPDIPSDGGSGQR